MMEVWFKPDYLSENKLLRRAAIRFWFPCILVTLIN